MLNKIQSNRKTSVRLCQIIFVLLLCYLWFYDFVVARSANAAQNVTQIVFSITSSAVTSTPNLRISATSELRLDTKGNPIQTSVIGASSNYNYYVTKSVTFPVTTSMILLEIQVDQDTWYKINSESTVMKILKDNSVLRSIKK